MQLQIGYHILEGKRLPLKKPLAILETVQQHSTCEDISSSPRSECVNGSSSSSDSSNGSTYCKVRTAGIVRAFASRISRSLRRWWGLCSAAAWWYGGAEQGKAVPHVLVAECHILLSIPTREGSLTAVGVLTWLTQTLLPPSTACPEAKHAVSDALQVVGVLRHKYLFKTRPRALISKPSGR